jgi:transcriptional regulator with XRE-family HTH domain
LKLFRVAAGLTQRSIAERLEVSANFVSMLERGKREPTLRYLQQFAGTVGVSAAVLLWEPSEAAEKRPESADLYLRMAGLMAQYAASMGVSRPAP